MNEPEALLNSYRIRTLQSIYCFNGVCMPESNDVRMTLNYILDNSVERYEDLPAIGMAAEESLSYREFYDRILALASQLIRRVKKGDRVAILSENSPHWGMAYFVHCPYRGGCQYPSFLIFRRRMSIISLMRWKYLCCLSLIAR